MKKLIAFSLLISLLLLCGCAGPEERAWNKGQKALSKEQYSEAASAFEKAGSFQDAQQLFQYASAWLDLENEDYTAAESGFQSLGDFNDSALMVTYSQAREQEAAAEEAISSNDADLAVRAAEEALTLYSGLSFFRDSDARAESCRGLLYNESTEWMNDGSYSAAASGFEALGTWQDSASLQKYCTAADLDSQGHYTEAAALYSQIPGVKDASARAEAALSRAYQLAAELKDGGDYETAIDAFAALGDYQDAREQRDNSTALLIRTLIRSGSYHEALQKFGLLKDHSAFSAVDSAESGNLELFLTGFMGVWINAHADVMNAFFSCNLLQPYLEPGGELDTQIRSELTDDTPHQNYGFIFNGAEVTELLALDDGYTAALVTGTASCLGPEGAMNLDQTLRVLIDTSKGSPIAAAALPA